MNSVSTTTVMLDDLGSTERAALDRLMREFAMRGWRDVDDAGQAIVDALSRRGGKASTRVVLGAVPGDFLRRNHIRRSDLEHVLDRLAGR